MEKKREAAGGATKIGSVGGTGTNFYRIGFNIHSNISLSIENTVYKLIFNKTYYNTQTDTIPLPPFPFLTLLSLLQVSQGPTRRRWKHTYT